MRSRTLIAGALLLFAVTRANAAPFTNGSFEVSALNPGSGFLTLAEGNTQITGWEVFDTAPEARTIDYIGTFWQAADGSRSVDLNGNLGPAGIRQTFDTVAGTTYLVEFALAGNPDGLPAIKQVDVQSGLSSGSFLFDASGTTRPNMGWVYHSLFFTAASSSTTLSFLSQTSGAFYGPALDDVSVSVAPEPASMALLATGVGLLLIRRRRRR
jgi:choice-of-anchor C domain-containing protein